MTDRELMQMALDALDSDNPDIQLRAATHLRAALAQPEQEPWGYISHKAWKMPVFVEADDLQAANLPFNNPDYTPVYKAPPQREWQRLTDEEIKGLVHFIDWTAGWTYVDFAKAIESKLREKNT